LELKYSPLTKKTLANLLTAAFRELSRHSLWAPWNIITGLTGVIDQCFSGYDHCSNIDFNASIQRNMIDFLMEVRWWVD
jgi:hypothetical protein